MELADRAPHPQTLASNETGITAWADRRADLLTVDVPDSVRAQTLATDPSLSPVLAEGRRPPTAWWRRHNDHGLVPQFTPPRVTIRSNFGRDSSLRNLSRARSLPPHTPPTLCGQPWGRFRTAGGGPRDLTRFFRPRPLSFPAYHDYDRWSSSGSMQSACCPARFDPPTNSLSRGRDIDAAGDLAFVLVWGPRGSSPAADGPRRALAPGLAPACGHDQECGGGSERGLEPGEIEGRGRRRSGCFIGRDHIMRAGSREVSRHAFYRLAVMAGPRGRAEAAHGGGRAGLGALACTWPVGRGLLLPAGGGVCVGPPGYSDRAYCTWPDRQPGMIGRAGQRPPYWLD